MLIRILLINLLEEYPIPSDLFPCGGCPMIYFEDSSAWESSLGAKVNAQVEVGAQGPQTSSKILHCCFFAQTNFEGQIFLKKKKGNVHLF